MPLIAEENPPPRVEHRAEAQVLETALPETRLNSTTLGRIRELGGENGNRFLCKVIGTYLKTSPGYLQSLREAIAGDDAEAMQTAAHSFKSSNGNMGADRTAPKSARLRCGSTPFFPRKGYA